MKLRLIGLDKIKHIIPQSKNPFIVARGLDFLHDGSFNSKYTLDDSSGRIFTNSLLPSFPGESWDRFFEGAEKIARGERVPLWLDIVTTGRCHCTCWHCFRSKYMNTSDLNLDVIETLIYDAYDLGTVMLGITGGEPMLHHDLFDIIRLVPKGMEILLYTTGHLMDEAFIRKAEETQLTRCIISLDHFDAEVVKNRRQHQGAFEEAINTLKLLAQSHIYTSVALCITEDLCTEEAFNRYMDLVCSLEVNEIRVILPIPQGRLQGENHKRLYVDARRVVRKIKEQTAGDESVPSIMLFSDFESSACFGCGAGFHYISVNNDGQVTPCVAVPLAFGNIHSGSLQEIYSTIMGSYFKSPGTTCFGRRVSRMVGRQGTIPMSYPYPIEYSKALASGCSVDGGQGAFFRNMGVPVCCRIDPQASSCRNKVSCF
jgi:MoaA/NifB/PqqE/SkfB family radical SAM enzyme